MAMLARNVQARIERDLARAGIVINGDHPCDPRVRNPRLYGRVLRHGTLGAGEAYMEGWWDCDALDEFTARILGLRLNEHVGWRAPLLARAVWASLVNLQSRSRAFHIGEAHYDIGNDLYQAMLGGSMTYSCAHWEAARDLDEAEEAKLDLVCRMLQLEPGQRLLDIGCGWGSLARHAAMRYGARVVGVTVSQRQAVFARELCAGLPVDIRLQDYRDVEERFDRIVSIGMLEHVGVRNYGTYFALVDRCLADDGLFVLQTIGGLRSARSTDPWIAKYIFPNSMLPSARQITAAVEGLFTLHEWQNRGADYDKTLVAWWRNFAAAWPTLRERYGERFYRMWRYYLLTCAGSFRAGYNQLWRIVLSKPGNGRSLPRAISTPMDHPNGRHTVVTPERVSLTQR